MTGLLQDLPARRAEIRPESVAIVGEGQRLSYGDLEALSNRIAHLLRELGCRPGDRVCLLLPRSPLTIACMLGVLKADGAYVPMDPAAPAARAERILRAAAPRIVVYDAEAAAAVETMRASGAIGPEVRTGGTGPGRNAADAFALSDRDAFPASAPPRANVPDAPAHLLFTSGSTGTPKGVIITHANVRAFLDWAIRHFGMSAEDRNSGHSPLQFDLSTFDIFGSLSTGAELHLVPPRLNLQPRKLVAWMREARLVQWFSVPSVLTLLIKTDALREGDLPELRRLMWCGEVLPSPVLAACMRRLPHVRFTNLYGPTEATIASSYYDVTTAPPGPEPVPIGRACDGEELLVLDDGLRPVQPGEIGNLYIGGVGLSPGYWRDSAKTDAAFIPDFRSPGSGARLYRTGDLARIGPDGEIHFLGRADSQIKSRGYRIELGEIEAALGTIDEVGECAVVAVPTDGFEGVAIGCAFSPAAGARVEATELRRRLALLLPAYMLPTRWMPFDALPKNANGKIDRPRIRDLFATAPEPVQGECR